MNAYQNVFHQFEKGFFASCALGILVQSCVGGITAMTILMHGTGMWEMIQLFFVVIVCLAFNGSIISVQKPKTVFNLFVISFIVCSIIAVYNAMR